MVMNTKHNAAKVAMVAVVLMAAALTPSVASAQPAMQGKFTLPCTTYWGAAVLPAGEYSFTVTKANSQVDIIRVRGAASVQHMSLRQKESRSEGSSLTLAEANGVAIARTLYLAEIGRSFRIPQAGAAKELLAKSSTIELTKVSITAGE